jgi:hypothetical protein
MVYELTDWTVSRPRLLHLGKLRTPLGSGAAARRMVATYYTVSRASAI